MIMKKAFLFVAVACACCSVLAQTSKPAWHAVIKVVGESGQPIPGANVEMSYYVQAPPGENEASGSIHGLTDTNGIVRLSHSNTGSIGLGFEVTKAGYYPTKKGHEFVQFQDTDPQKWNPTLTLVLKKIGHPIAMYAKHVETKMPAEDHPVGFDLTVGDWIAPYGAGKHADIFFTVHRKITSPQKFDADLELTFPNPGDGIVVMPPVSTDTGFSPLVMPRFAPTGDYQRALKWSYHNFTETAEPASGYFFRVRTVLDSNGNVKSALYGKIQGDVRFYVGTRVPRAGISFTYYLDPTPNDRNVEFDPKQDLLNGLSFDAQVKSP